MGGGAPPGDEDELQFEVVFAQQSFGRKASEALHPEREPPAMIEQIRRLILGGQCLRGVRFKRSVPIWNSSG
jgi:hypothetical protein